MPDGAFPDQQCTEKGPVVFQLTPPGPYLTTVGIDGVLPGGCNCHIGPEVEKVCLSSEPIRQANVVRACTTDEIRLRPAHHIRFHLPQERTADSYDGPGERRYEVGLDTERVVVLGREENAVAWDSLAASITPLPNAAAPSPITSR